MKRIRIGKDIAINWVVSINGENQNLEDKDLTIQLTDPKGAVEDVEVFTVTDNKISFAFYGTAFKVLGKYTLTLWLNKGQEGQTVLDAVDCFQLVRYTNEESC